MNYFTKVKKLILDSLRYFLENMKQHFVQIKNVINNTNSTDTDKPLSANMGNVLADNITDISSKVGDSSVINPEFRPEFDRGGLVGVMNYFLTYLENKLSNKANIYHSDSTGSNGMADKGTYGHVQLSYGLEDLDARFITGNATSTYTGNLLLNEIRKLDNTLGQKRELWSGGNGGNFLHGTQSVTLSEPISEQRYGIVLCWSGFDLNTNKCTNTDFWYTFIPKWHLEFAGAGVHCSYTGHWNNISKYVYVEDTKIRGHELNDKVRTVGGVTENNNKSALRRVWGV